MSFSTKANAASTKSKKEEKKKDDIVKKENDVEEHKDSRGAPVKDEDVEMEDEVKPEEDAAATDSDSAREFFPLRRQLATQTLQPLPTLSPWM